MSEVEAYRKAFAEYQEARERVREVVGIVRDVADLLKDHPQRFQFKNAPSHRSNPGTPVSNIDASSWPTAGDIQNAISVWDSLFNAMQAAWQRIPPPERIALETPPSVMML
jgi:hypothetical protein